MFDHSTVKDLLQSAWAKRREGNYDEARRLVGEAEKQCEPDDFRSLGWICHVYMQFEYDHHNYSEALGWCQRSLDHCRRSGDLFQIANAVRHLADLQRHLGMGEESERHYREAIRIYRAQTDTNPGTLANALRGFSILLEKSGRVEEATAAWRETRALYADCDIQAGVAEADQHLAGLPGN